MSATSTPPVTPETEPEASRGKEDEEEEDVISDISTETFNLGESVLLDGRTRAKVAYFGQVLFSHDDDWIGLALEEPVGKHSGQVGGTEYFKCRPLHGLFVRSHRLQRASGERVKSPYRPMRLLRPKTLAEDDPSLADSLSMSTCPTYYLARAGMIRSDSPADTGELSGKLERLVEELAHLSDETLTFGHSPSATTHKAPLKRPKMQAKRSIVAIRPHAKLD